MGGEDDFSSFGLRSHVGLRNVSAYYCSLRIDSFGRARLVLSSVLVLQSCVLLFLY